MDRICYELIAIMSMCIVYCIYVRERKGQEDGGKGWERKRYKKRDKSVRDIEKSLVIKTFQLGKESYSFHKYKIAL